MNQYEFEQKIKAYIKQSDFGTQSAVARKLGYGVDTFNKWIRGVNQIPYNVIIDVCKIIRLGQKQTDELVELAGYIVTSQNVPELELQKSDTSSPNTEKKTQSDSLFRAAMQACLIHSNFDKAETLCRQIEEIDPYYPGLNTVKDEVKYLRWEYRKKRLRVISTRIREADKRTWQIIPLFVFVHTLEVAVNFIDFIDWIIDAVSAIKPIKRILEFLRIITAIVRPLFR